MTDSTATFRSESLSLYEAAVEGDAAAWARLYERFSLQLARLSRGCALEPEDFVQSCFVDAFRYRAQLRDVRKFPGWLFGIARNKRRAAFHVKMRAPITAGITKQPDELTADGSPERSALLKQALSSLPEQALSCWVGCHIEGRTFHEIARSEGISVSTAKRRAQRVKGRLSGMGYRS